MKKVIIGIGLIFAAVTTIAFTTTNKDKVPQAVKDAFAKKFPTAKKVDWEKENDKEWEAEFKMNKVEYSANFTEDGTWMETEHKIEENEIPQAVMASLKSNFTGYEIEEAEISETTKGTVYEFEIEKGKSEMEVTIDNNGKVIKKQSEENEDDKD
ncbi:MAG: hypothetical protein CL868_15675 [Cytophagaceae bacterium]|nr:hypothetical protein [Cytophagaceae bacterium]|tara:strand:- start:1536 stop:2000 length:465 start_codon:yes stop_codon:yes gene_type:complete